jgi:hypothetical protein
MKLTCKVCGIIKNCHMNYSSDVLSAVCDPCMFGRFAELWEIEEGEMPSVITNTPRESLEHQLLLAWQHIAVMRAEFASLARSYEKFRTDE